MRYLGHDAKGYHWACVWCGEGEVTRDPAGPASCERCEVRTQGRER